MFLLLPSAQHDATERYRARLQELGHEVTDDEEEDDDEDDDDEEDTEEEGEESSDL